LQAKIRLSQRPDGDATIAARGRREGRAHTPEIGLSGLSLIVGAIKQWRRSLFFALVCCAVLLGPAGAQSPPLLLIGVLDGTSEAAARTNHGALREGLRQLGYVEGRNVRFEYRFANGALDRLPELAVELVRLNPHVIVSGPLPANLALKKATSTIPVVMATGADPVGFGLAQSLSHPGGNFTGMTNFAEELASKQLDVIRELLPDITRIGALVNVTNPLHVPQWQETQDAAQKATLSVVRYDYQAIEDMERAFSRFVDEKVQAVLIPPDVTFNAQRERIVALAAKSNLPAVYFNRLYVQSGGLLSYGPNISDGYLRAATFIDKIIKGEKPGALPIERPTRIELVVNLKAAKALGLTVSPVFLARADEVIE
jgi:putative ABC transport system substrate-binding protein